MPSPTDAFVALTAPMRPVVAVATQSPRFVMTYDDGPTPRETEDVLRALDEAGATATFFVLLTRVRRAPELLRRVADLGHEIGLHGMDHTRLTTISGAEVFRRTRWAKAELEDRLGRPVRWFRPPYGDLNRAATAGIRAAGLTPVLWRGGVGDHLELSPAERHERSRPALVPGGIMLLHDGYADACDNAFDPPAPPVDRYALTADVLRLAAERGLRGASLGEAVALGRVVKL